MRYRRISADGHIDLNWLPADLFSSEAPAALKDRMPHVVDGELGPTWVTGKGVSFGLQNGIGPTGRKYVPGKLGRVDVMETTGLFSDGEKGIRRVTDPDMRLRDMEYDGIDAEVIYGLLGVAVRMRDPEASRVVTRIYNDWIADFCRSHPDRQIGLAIIPNDDVDVAVAEVHRAARLGLKGLDLTVSWDMESLCHPMWEPLFAAVAEVDLPLHLHTAPHVPWDFRTRFPGTHGDALNFQITSVFQMTLGNMIAAIIGRGYLERYPNMRVAFAECGTGWIPYLLERMDFLYHDSFRQLPLAMPPSDYWRRQCRATFQFDETGAGLIDAMGVETLMWGADFPHLDGVWPESGKYIERQFAGLPEEDIYRITCDNAARFYRLPNERAAPEFREAAAA